MVVHSSWLLGQVACLRSGLVESILRARNSGPAEHLELLQSDSFILALLQLFGDLSVALVDTLLPVFLVGVALLDVLQGLEDRVLHLALLLDHFFVQGRVQQRNRWDAVGLATWPIQ